MDDYGPLNPEYYHVKKCHRSKLNVLAKGNYPKLSNCKRFALEKKGLSFNFSPQAREGRLEDTCEVLQCAEISTGLLRNNDSRYDYYSLFGNLSLNSTCVPSLGMFYFISKRGNYSESVEVCRNKNGVLADVTTEYRTNALAKLLADVGGEEAYINLKRDISSDFITTNGDLLDCTSYRAWAPGHPKKRGKTDCVTITRHQTWRSVSCEVRLAAICEIIPGKNTGKPSLNIM
ncbi:PREDICTED: pulmonary surfactant-associated protein A [Papilio polytes]|uniref:pulmonary surfactant-associated protein A n=1 Tax=Papilio polytes TaxID=76194 RepID=UPI00067607B6|nr:PREDICTED: pulmonary surfactant-associated protein A [Papilio polytes]